MSKNGIPDRWWPYKSMGERVPGTPFVAFKAPLADRYFRKGCDPSTIFTPKMVVQRLPGLKMVIDLTNTQRYYYSDTFVQAGVKYCKLAVPGQAVPSDQLVTQFCNIVHDFLNSPDCDKDTLIGVHCTHGVNRTGYFICSFMVRHLLMHPREAVNVFAEARGHSIERENYVQALHQQYHKYKRRTPPSSAGIGVPPGVPHPFAENALEFNEANQSTSKRVSISQNMSELTPTMPNQIHSWREMSSSKSVTSRRRKQSMMSDSDHSAALDVNHHSQQLRSEDPTYLAVDWRRGLLPPFAQGPRDVPRAPAPPFPAATRATWENSGPSRGGPAGAWRAEGGDRRGHSFGGFWREGRGAAKRCEGREGLDGGGGRRRDLHTTRNPFYSRPVDRHV